MSRRPFFLLIACFLALAVHAGAQSSDKPKTTSAKDPAKKTAKDAEAKRILDERRLNAQSLLISLAVDARKFSDQTLRARTQARIADALWDLDRDRARTMFRAAW